MPDTKTTGVCPKCDGSARRSAPANLYRTREGKVMAYGYDEATDTLMCDNCGGQTMGHSTGKVLLRADGTPCLHTYTVTNAGRCLTKYVCKDCPHTFYIDSGD